MANSYLMLVPRAEVNRTVVPTRRPNAELRTREHLTASEIEALVAAAKANRHGHRDATMILITFRHGLRTAELCDLQWDQSEFGVAVLHVRRSRMAPPVLVHSGATNCAPCGSIEIAIGRNQGVGGANNRVKLNAHPLDQLKLTLDFRGIFGSVDVLI